MCFVKYEVRCVLFCVKFLTELWFEKKTCGIMTCGLNNQETDRNLFSALI